MAITGGDTKTNAIYMGQPSPGNLPTAALSTFESLTGITFNAVLTFANPVDNWTDYCAPWQFTSGLNWVSWLQSSDSNQIVFGMDLVPWSATGTTTAPVSNPDTWEAQGAAGDFNTYYTTLAENLVSYGVFENGQPFVIRLGIEANGNWEADWVGSTSAEQTAWAQTFANCVTSMRAVAGTNFLFVWNPNAAYGDGTTDLASWYPGNDYVDIIGMDIYDQDAQTDETVAQEGWSTFAANTNGSNSVDDIVSFAAANSKPIAICEWGLSSSDDADYVNGIGGLVSGNSCAFQSYFNSGTDGIPVLSGSYPDSLAAYKTQFGGSSGGPAHTASAALTVTPEVAAEGPPVKFAAAGSPVAVSASTFSLTPAAVGDFILCELNVDSTTAWASALSSSNVTWSVLAAHTAGAADGFYSTVFIGEVTSTSEATVTVSYSSGTPATLGQAQEFSAAAGFSAVTLDASAATGSGAGTAYPSITPGHGSGELYWAWIYNDGSATAGSAPGYTYSIDSNGNGSCWNASCSSSAQAPAWGDSSKRDGIAVMLYEAAAPHTATASLTVTPSLTAESPVAHDASASLAVTPAATASGAGPAHTATASLTVTPVTAAAAAAAVTPAFPLAPLDLRCELDLDGSQTDVSSYVYQRAGTSAPVSLTRGRADESTQANPGTAAWEWNNRDGRFSPKNPLSPYYGQLGRNTPVRWSVPAQSSYLRSETDSDSGASCPDSSSLHITGDIDIRLDVKLTDYGNHNLMFKWGSSGNFGWFLELTGGAVQFFWSTTGSDYPSATSTVPLPVGRLTLRVTLAVSTGTVTFWTGPPGNADAGTGWTQLGSAIVTGPTSVYASTAVIWILGWYGSVYEAEVRSGIGGTVKAHPVFSAQAAGTTSFSDAQSNTWNLGGTAEISDRDYRWHGQMSAQPPKWDVTGRDMAVKAQAGGVLRIISQGQAPLMSPMKRAVTLLPAAKAPVAYWPMEDAAGASAFGSASGGQPMYFSGSPQLSSNSDFACSASLPVTNGAAFTGQVSYAGTWTDNQAAFLMEIPSGAEADTAVVVSLATGGTVATLTLRYRTAGSGSLELYGYNASGTQLFDSGATGFAANGKPLLISVALQDAGGGDITWHLDGWAPGAASPTGNSGTISGTVGPVTRVALGRDGTLTGTVFGHCAVLAAYQQLYNLFTATNPNGVSTGALNGWAGEPAATRFTRLAGENGYAARVIGAPAASAAMGAQAIDTLGNLLQACEDADRGQIFEPRQALALGYRTLASMYSQSPALTLDYSASEPGGADGNPDDSGLDPTYDDLLSRNDWTLTRSAGTGADGATYQYQLNDGSPMSITGIGDYADTKSVNVQSDGQLPNTAGWMVHVGTVDEARWTAIPLNLARSEMADLYWDALEADIGDFTEITDAPDLVVYDPVKQLVFQVTEKLGGFWYLMSFNAVPESPYEVAAAGTARADTAGSQLHAACSSSATSLSVDVAAGNLWTTSGGDLPFDINVAGERMTVTDITGSSSPQAFTVTRAVNGVSKAQAHRAAVALWDTPVAAL